MGTEQQFCLKWNNHRSTLFSVFDTLLEEEALVDVTLSADGQFLRAHRVILSACSPYFRNLFRSSLLNDKHPVVFMKDVDFDNLKSLVEYMYKGEANVPQHMLSSFIRTAESLQIRGLAECATKQLESEGIQNSSSQSGSKADHPEQSNHSSTSHRNSSSPISKKSSDSSARKRHNNNSVDVAAAIASQQESILAARLGGNLFNPELLFRQPPPLGLPGLPHLTAPLKKPRKSSDPKQANHFGHLGFGAMANLPVTLPLPMVASKSKRKDKTPTQDKSGTSNNNNYESGDEGALKIDEDADAGKENRGVDRSPTGDDDIAELDPSNGISTEDEDEEEPSMPGPGSELPGSARIVNPWTGEPIHLSEDQEDKNPLDDSGLVGWPNMLRDFSGGEMSTSSPLPSSTSTMATLTLTKSDVKKELPPRGPDGNSPRLKRLNSAAQRNVYSMVQGTDGTVKYRCNACSRTFKLKCTLLRHVRHQHQGRFVPHPCKGCGQVFKRTDHLKVHMRKIHGLNSKSPVNQDREAPATPPIEEQTPQNPKT